MVIYGNNELTISDVIHRHNRRICDEQRLFLVRCIVTFLVITISSKYLLRRQDVVSAICHGLYQPDRDSPSWLSTTNGGLGIPVALRTSANRPVTRGYSR
jgi:hypothetical protein